MRSYISPADCTVYAEGNSSTLVELAIVSLPTRLTVNTMMTKLASMSNAWHYNGVFTDTNDLHGAKSNQCGNMSDKVPGGTLAIHTVYSMYGLC